MNNETFWKEFIPAIEKQFGPIEYITMCQSFEESDAFKHIAGIGYTTPCETVGCNNISANCCCFCLKAICSRCSHDAISEEGYDAYACADCIA